MLRTLNYCGLFNENKTDLLNLILILRSTAGGWLLS